MCPGIGLSLYGSKREIWNVGCIFIDGGRLSLYALSPTRLVIVKGPIACSLTFLRALLFSCFDSVATPCLLVSDLGLGIVSYLLVPIVFLVRIVFRFVIYLVTQLGVSHDPEFQGLVSYLVLSVLYRCWDDIHNWQRRVFVLLYLKLCCCNRTRR